jgi:hypothetical protein
MRDFQCNYVLRLKHLERTCFQFVSHIASSQFLGMVDENTVKAFH